jgi:hypothetical protein
MVLEIREQIYNYFHNNKHCQSFFFQQNQEERFVAYYTSMYLLQDTTESLSEHRNNGFSKNPYKAYIEFWGVMQAAIIQQDAIRELYGAVTGLELDTNDLKAWQELRFLRNTCAGHPAKRNKPKSEPLSRTFMGRNFGDYLSFTYEKWEKPISMNISESILNNISNPKVELGKLMDAYEKEAGKILNEILKFMKDKWTNV